MSSDDHPDGPPRSAGAVGVWLAALAIPVVAILGVAAVIAGSGSDDLAATAAPTASSTSAEVPPLDLAMVPASTASHYHAARADPDTYRHVPCFCGCEEFLGHSDLYDCFVRADGEGWDAHAAGCGICIAESISVQDLLEGGHDAASIRTEVISQYGSTPTTAPPATTQRS
jgi:hypothetical protein